MRFVATIVMSLLIAECAVAEHIYWCSSTVEETGGPFCPSDGEKDPMSLQTVTINS